MYIADLHIHSKYSRATSRDCDAEHLDLWARKKGIQLIGTGDFSHPAWRSELREALLPDPEREGLYTLKKERALTWKTAGDTLPCRFMVTGEISCIYKKNGRTRKIHVLIILPGLDEAEALSLRLEAIGNIHSDGRPILGLDCRDLLEITLETCPGAIFIPAHIWTPHFSLFGAFSGFDSMEECFSDLTGEIRAIETGLSSDPPMNRRISSLDGITLVSNSDAHSPQKLGREANLIDAELSYSGLKRAIETEQGFLGTIEFFPEEGKYHLDGHRDCGVRLEPEGAERLGERCPVCGKRLTIGVLHRVCELADRPEGYSQRGDKPFERLVPLPELIAAAIGVSSVSKRTQELYERLLFELGTEFHILRKAPLPLIERTAGRLVSEGIRRMREGEISLSPGYDGLFGELMLFSETERRELSGQSSLFGSDTVAVAKKCSSASLKRNATILPEAPAPQRENAEQLLAICSDKRATAVIAGPGTGKTKTLVSRIAYLIENLGVKPSHITAVTFTNQAASEMKERLEARLGGKRAIRGMTIGTFHSICMAMLEKKPLLGEPQAIRLVRGLLRERRLEYSPRDVLNAISLHKCGEADDIFPELSQAYALECARLGARDMDDLLIDALELKECALPCFSHLFVDEFQDINYLQRRLVRKWSECGKSLFVIGDPDQSIYGFRGASAMCFTELTEDIPELSTIALKINYRSTPEILSEALRMISANEGGERMLSPDKKSGAPVRVIHTESPYDEGIWIAKEIARLAGGTDMLSASGTVEAPKAFSDMAVLCRTHSQLERISECLVRESIPCVITGRGGELEHPSVAGALAFFCFMMDNNDVCSLSQCLELTWDMTAEEAQRTAERFRTEDKSVLSSALLRAGCPTLMLTDADSFDIREKPRKLLELWVTSHGKTDALEKLMDISLFYSGMRELSDALLLGTDADIARACGKSYASGAVRMSTLHGAKGLEFPVVFLAGVSGGSLPSKRENTDISEELRLLFVGMTRARDELIISCSGKPSEFLSRLSDDAIRQEARPAGAQMAFQPRLF